MLVSSVASTKGSTGIVALAETEYAGSEVGYISAMGSVAKTAAAES